MYYRFPTNLDWPIKDLFSKKLYTFCRLISHPQNDGGGALILILPNRRGAYSKGTLILLGGGGGLIQGFTVTQGISQSGGALPS